MIEGVDILEYVPDDENVGLLRVGPGFSTGLKISPKAEPSLQNLLESLISEQTTYLGDFEN
jgi:hypothetical protein